MRKKYFVYRSKTYKKLIKISGHLLVSLLGTLTLTLTLKLTTNPNRIPEP